MLNYRKQLFKGIRHLILLTAGICFLTYLLCEKIELKNYLILQSREYIITFLEICIGIYSTVVTLLASQKTKFTVLLARRNLDYKFVSAVSLGLIINIITCLILSIFKANCKLIFSFKITLCVLSFLYFALFLFVLISMFCYNIAESVKEAEEENKQINKIMTDIEEIRKKIGNNS